MEWIQRCHPVILTTTLVLTGLGVVTVYSASAILAMDRYQDPYFFVKRQAGYAVLGVGAMAVGMRVNYRRLGTWARPCLLLTLLLLVSVFVPPLAKEAGGAKRWVHVGGFAFQPAEVAKLTLVLYLAHVLATRRGQLHRFVEGYLPIVSVLGAVFLLILMQPDLGTAVVLVGVAGILLFVGGVPTSYLIGSLVAVLPFLYVSVASVGFRRRRLLAFWDPWSDRAHAGFQVVQSLLALGRGGLVGVGPGEGRQKLFFLPEAHTDFVFAVIGEEFGFVGCLLVLGLFGVLLWSGMAVAWRAGDLFARYLACGITSMILLPAVINIGVVVGFLPTKGLPLPFMSLGGSSLLVTLTAVGILLGISAQVPTPKGRQGDRETESGEDLASLP